MITKNYKIVRRVIKILHNDARILSDKAIDERINKLKQEAVTVALEQCYILNKNLDISIDYYPNFSPSEMPAGPMPIIKSWQECLKRYFSVPCVVSIVIRDKSEF